MNSFGSIPLPPSFYLSLYLPTPHPSTRITLGRLASSTCCQTSSRSTLFSHYFLFPTPIPQKVTQADRSAAARKDAENMTQLLEGNAASLAEIKDQNRGNAENLAEMLSLLKLLASPAAPASGVGAAAVVEQWTIDAKSVKFEKEEDDDGDLVKVKLGSGSFGTVYVVS